MLTHTESLHSLTSRAAPLSPLPLPCLQLLKDKLAILADGGLLPQQPQQQQEDDGAGPPGAPRLLLPLQGPLLPDSLLSIVQVTSAGGGPRRCASQAGRARLAAAAQQTAMTRRDARRC